MDNTAILTQDAFNRFLRSLYQGLLYTVAVTLATFLFGVFNGWTPGEAIDFMLVGQSLAQALGVAVFSYLMRRFGDISNIFPTPLPPPEPGFPTQAPKRALEGV